MGIVIMIFVTASLIGWIGLIAQFLAQKLTHSPWVSDSSRNCGPLEDKSFGESYLENYMNSNFLTSKLEKIAHNVPVNLLLIIFLLRQMVSNKSFWNMKELAANQNIE